MNPKGKAADLIIKFYNVQEGDHYISKGMAKECALITIEEILNSVVTQAWNPAAHKYWYEVKLELEKL